MKKKRWLLEEEKILVDAFFKNEGQINPYLINTCKHALVQNGFDECDSKKIRAKLYDIKRIKYLM